MNLKLNWIYSQIIIEPKGNSIREREIRIRRKKTRLNYYIHIFTSFFSFYFYNNNINIVIVIKNRCILVALAYVDMQKTPEATALYQRAQTYVLHTKLGLQQSHGFADDSVLKVTLEDIDQLEQTIRTGIWKACASWYINNNNENESSLDGDGDVDMDKKKNNSMEQVITKKMNQLQLNVSDEAALIKRLNVYPSTLTGNDPSKVPHLIDFPPSFTPVSSKPFYFDLAANHIKYPTSLEERAKSDKPSGLWKYLGFSGN